MTAPLTKIKNAGVFKTVSGIEVNQNGTWKRIVKGEINDNGTWKTFFVNKTTITISGDDAEPLRTNINLDTYAPLVNLGAQVFLGDVDVIIQGDTLIFSNDTCIPAFNTGSKIYVSNSQL